MALHVLMSSVFEVVYLCLLSLAELKKLRCK